jgi:ribonuclease J
MTASTGDELVFVPLGGTGEIGMNLNLYGFGPPGDKTWLMVDLGVTFSDGNLPGIDVIMPDPTFITERRDRLAGILLTHAHEDHLGAVPYLWDRLRCPVYATPFTAAILRRKLGEAFFEETLEITVVELGSRFSIGPFDLELITLTHSIPEPNAVAIRCDLGTVIHTGDWKFDPDPVVGPAADEEALRRFGDEGVLAVIGDSTNVFTPGTSGSEGDLLDSLTEVIGACEKRVAVACFASNVARLHTIAAAARANGRDVVLAGRSLHRIEAAARETGYLEDVPAFIREEDAGYLPDNKTAIICTGSQGEPRAALSRIATGNHPNVSLGAGDKVIFSSRVIPGNETAIHELQNKLTLRGIDIITWNDALVHVSGHPARDELSLMYQYVRPRIAVPVHGEARHLAAHAALAKTCQVAETVVAENGAMVRLAPGAAGIIDHVPAGRLYVDGKRLVAANGEAVRGRGRIAYNGTAMVTVVVNEDGRLVGSAQLSHLGLLDDPDDELESAVLKAIETAIHKMTAQSRRDDNAVREIARLAARRSFRESLGKKPQTQVHLVRIAKEN